MNTEKAGFLISQISEKYKTRFWSRVDKRGSGECWLWQRGCFSSGYGQIRVGGPRAYGAHVVAWVLTHGEVPADLCVCHKCDVPRCCNVAHMFLGTRAENRFDCVEKNRHAKGDTCGPRLYPERYPRGEDHHARRRPECLARGERHGSRTHPERLPRGVDNKKAKFTEVQICAIRALHTVGGFSNRYIARHLGVVSTTIDHIIHRRTWKHVVCSHTVDEAIIEALRVKGEGQDALMSTLKNLEALSKIIKCP